MPLRRLTSSFRAGAGPSRPSVHRWGEGMQLPLATGQMNTPPDPMKRLLPPLPPPHSGR